MPILQIKLTLPAHDALRSIQTLHRAEAGNITRMMTLQKQSLVLDERIVKARLKGIKDVTKALQEQSRTAKSSTGSGGRGGGSSFVGGIVGGFAGSAVSSLIGFGKEKITEAKNAVRDLGEQVSKTDVVFGNSATQMQAWGRTTLDTIGMSQRASLEAASSFGALFQSMEIGSDRSATMSKRLTELAGDLSSFYNSSTKEAIDALKSGLVGETEPLRRYGVVLNESVIKNEAKRLGLISDTKAALDPLVKLESTYSLILQKTAAAQGDYIRTQDSIANRERKIASLMEETNVRIGKELEPSYQKLLQVAEHLGKSKGLDVFIQKGVNPLFKVLGDGAVHLDRWVVALDAYAEQLEKINGITLKKGSVLWYLTRPFTSFGDTAKAALETLEANNVENKAKASPEYRVKQAKRLIYLANKGKVGALSAKEVTELDSVGRELGIDTNLHATRIAPSGNDYQNFYRRLEGGANTVLSDYEKAKPERESARMVADGDEESKRRLASVNREIAQGEREREAAEKKRREAAEKAIQDEKDAAKRAKLAEAEKKRRAEQERKENQQADILRLRTSRNVSNYSFTDALDLLGKAQDAQLPPLAKQLRGLSGSLLGSDKKIAEEAFKQAGGKFDKEGKVIGTRLAIAEREAAIAEAERDHTERLRQVSEEIAQARKRLKDATEDAAAEMKKQAEDSREQREKNLQNFTAKLALENKQLQWQFEDTKVTGDLGKRRRVLADQLDNDLRQSGLQFIGDLERGDPNAVLAQEVRVEGIERANKEAMSDLIAEGLQKAFASVGQAFAPLTNPTKAPPTQGQKDRLAVSETLRQVFADAGSAAGPEFFKGLLSGSGNDARNAFRTLGQVAGDGFARKLTEALIDKPIQRVFDDMAKKIADGGKIGGMHLYQGAMAIYSAAQALASARSGKGGGLLAWGLGAIAGAFIPGVGWAAGGAIASSLYRQDYAGAAISALGTDWASNGLGRVGGSGINVSNNGGGSTVKSGGGTTSTSKAAKQPARIVNVTYNMNGDVNDRQDAERARKARVDELQSALKAVQ